MRCILYCRVSYKNQYILIVYYDNFFLLYTSIIEFNYALILLVVIPALLWVNKEQWSL